MVAVSCDSCGHEADAAEMFVCGDCFEAHFCSLEHGQHHQHSDIGVNLRRLVGSTDFTLALKALVNTYMKAVDYNERDIVFNRSEWDQSETYFVNKLSKSEHGKFRRVYETFTTSLMKTLRQNLFEGQQTMTEPGQALIDIFLEENALSWRQSKKAIPNVWWRLIDLLLSYKNDKKRRFAIAEDLRVFVMKGGPVLGGGRNTLNY